MSDKNKKRNLKKLYNLHAWLGFQLAVIMFVVLATGTIATVSNEIDWLIFKELRASEKPEKEGKLPTSDDWDKIYTAVKFAYPDAAPRYLTTMGEDYLTYRVAAEDESLHAKFIQVDQWTHELTGTVPRLTVQRFFRDFHRYLFMPAFPGIIFVCALAFVLALAIYTGLKTTRNWKNALWRIRFNQGTRIALSDTHKIFGLWGIWFSILITITGIWYFYEFSFQLFGSRLEPAAPKVETAQVSTQTVSPMTLSADEFGKIVAIAQTAHQNWHITSIVIPADTAGLVQFRGVKNNPLLRDRAYRVFINPVTYQIESVFTPDSIGLNAYLNEYADPLHFGHFGGLWTKLIWFIFGIGLTGLSITGVLMSWKRTKSKRLTQIQVATLPLLLLSFVAFMFWYQRFT